MISVSVTLDVRGKKVPANEVKDANVADGLRKIGQQVGAALAKVTCPEHQKSATNVRVHVDASGNADLAYDACCDKMRELVGQALG